MQAVIFCGGLATRLGSLSKTIPKSMMKIHDKTFLEYQLEFLKNGNIDTVLLLVGHLGEQIERHIGDGRRFDMDISYSYDGEELIGPMGALKQAASLLEDTFLSLYGDSYVFLDIPRLCREFQKTKKTAMMAVFENHDDYDASNLIVDDSMVIRYGGEKTRDMTFIDYGLSIFDKKTLLSKIPRNCFFSTGDLYTRLSQEQELAAFIVDKRFYHIGDPPSLEEFALAVDRGLIPTF